MSSWFGIDKFQELKNKVASSLPIGDENLFGKLTLTTPELTAERERIEKEERRKEQVRDYLAEILPWETRDEEREILVEDCRDVILALSKREETFTGPYTCPGLGETLRDGNNNVDNDDDGDDAGVGGTNENDKNAPSGEKKESKTGPNADMASGLSAEEKLEKLEPLPPLLDNFDLDVHVGLIQRLLEVDPNLVEMQSLLSGGGEKERTFWRNYFFHCAYARYEIGLSVEEIWASKPPPPSAEEIAADSYHGSASSAAATGGGSASDYDDDNHDDDDVDGTSEDEITFEDPSGIGGGGKESSVRGVNGSVSAASSVSSIPTSSSVPGTVTAAKSSPSGVDVARGVSAPSSPPTSTAGTDYELIDDDTGGFDNDIDGGDNDQDLDDLEAEIARELED